MARKKRAAAVCKQTFTFVGNQQQQSTQKWCFLKEKGALENLQGAYFVCQYRTSDLEICNYLGKPPHYYDDDYLVLQV